MKTLNVIRIIILIQFFSMQYYAQQTSMPNTMIDINYSNKSLFFNNGTETIKNNGSILLKLNNSFEMNAMIAFTRGIKSQHHKLYGGLGINYSEFNILRHIYNDNSSSYQGHFPSTYSYNPDALNYNLQAIRFQFHLNHFTFYKRMILFQKLGLAYTSFIKKFMTEAQYIEKYGNSYPDRDPAYITPSNPEGWYFVNNYTYTNKNDLDIYKNGVNVFYSLGFGIRIKNFCPFIGFETSYVSGKFQSVYFKGQIGVNYSFIKR